MAAVERACGNFHPASHHLICTFVAMEDIIEKLVEILRPLKGTGELYFEDDKVGPDEPIRKAVGAALKRLDVSGLGLCPLCCS